MDQRVKSEFVCKKKNPKSKKEIMSIIKCRDQFLAAKKDVLTYVDVKGDGNCFFRTIAAYYRRTGGHIPGVHRPSDHRELRRYIVGEFSKQVYDDPELASVLSALSAKPIEKMLSKLAKSCVWRVPAFEMMVERTPAIIGVNLRMYRVNNNGGKYTVTESLYTPHDGPAMPTTISMLLSGGHYGLIHRVGDVNLSHGMAENESDDEKNEENENDSDSDSDDDNNNNNNEENENEENEEEALMKQLKKNSNEMERQRILKEKALALEKKKANNFMKMTLSASHKKLSGHNLSPGKNLQKIAKQNLINQSPKRSTLRKPRIVRETESAQIAQIAQIAQNKATKLEQARASLAAATAAKKAVYQQYSLTNSNSNSNSNSNNNSLKKMYVYNDVRVPFLKAELTAMGITFKPKNTKPLLYKAFIKATRKRQ
jgi:hypothetical protein